MDKLAGKVAFITGGSKGAGLGIARACVAAGMKVAIAGSGREALLRAADDLARGGAIVLPVQLDVSQHGAWEAAAVRTEAELGPVDVLCNNAGVGTPFRPLWELPVEEWHRLMGTNLSGVYYGISTFAGRMKARGQGGHIVNICSIAALLPMAEFGAYVASKAGVLGLSEVLRLELAPWQIGVSVCCPARLRSDFYQRQLHERAPASENAFDPARLEAASKTLESGMDPIDFGEKILQAIRENRLYVMTHPQYRAAVAARFDEILAAFDHPAG